MPKFMIFTCLMLFWAFYEMSGGADFKPLERQITSAAPWETNRPANRIVEAPAVQPADIQVTQHQSPAYKVMLAHQTNAFEPPAIVNARAEEVLEAAGVANVDLRLVLGNRVNMREGPGTNHLVLATVSRGTQAEVIAINGDGWAQIRLVESGARGWMAVRLLGDG